MTETDFHDFNKISPSAIALLFTKGLTDIPYAREAAALLSGLEEKDQSSPGKDFLFWIRTLHFEERYRSIDQLLNSEGNRNILELSSGLSFRGLDFIKNGGIHYIDTDLPDIVSMKQKLISGLNARQHNDSKLELLPLNALDEKAFNGIIDHFPRGEVTIINEGLLMYLDSAEKKRLCNIIYNILKHRGGCWITADIYVKRNEKVNHSPDLTRQFYEEHKIEENKFDSFDSARSFFSDHGFMIGQESLADFSNLSSIKHLKDFPLEMEILRSRGRQKIRATWQLKINIPEKSASNFQ